MTNISTGDLEVDDAIVLLLGAPSSPQLNGEIQGITRLEKLIFLLERETSADSWMTESADFKPYNYGPFSAKVYRAVDMLEAAGLLVDSARDSKSGEDSWEKGNAIYDSADIDPYTTRDFKLTTLGWRYYEKLENALTRDQRDDLSKFKSQFASIPLRQLVRYVYERYDTFTEKSLIREDVLTD
ncbi:hypothetical protein [Mycobacteroides immunogenum]|uniref:hypothetical protein n=1 Tax=Mycobacteroides immunogenum TaxID=83262 RepID=UPI0006BA654D|nr:hypothetical protein [Mycobacteroides immunogenum]KPG44026.1 hypothetical protein AN916_26030 [Mycobacteroides immunogenum]MCV7306805.1 hypothetical protein [Mycobacteroides immunogenum]